MAILYIFHFCWTYILYGFWGHEQLSTIQIILMYSLVALAIHQFEEYVFPGGAPLVINKATYGEKMIINTIQEIHCLLVSLTLVHIFSIF